MSHATGEILTVKQLAARLGLKPATLHYAAYRGDAPITLQPHTAGAGKAWKGDLGEVTAWAKADRLVSQKLGTFSAVINRRPVAPVAPAAPAPAASRRTTAAARGGDDGGGGKSPEQEEVDLRKGAASALWTETRALMLRGQLVKKSTAVNAVAAIGAACRVALLPIPDRLSHLLTPEAREQLRQELDAALEAIKHADLFASRVAEDAKELEDPGELRG